MIAVGIDISKAKSTVAVIDPDGTVLARFVCFILFAFKLAGGEQRFMLFANGKSTRDRRASIARECGSFGGTK